MKNKDYNKLLNFIEELSWMLNSYKDLDLNHLVNELKLNSDLRNERVHNISSTNEREKFIGILPLLLNDKQLFSKNADLIEFAESTFNIEISRKDKRSRYELIGMTIMELLKLDNKKFDKTFQALNKITKNDILYNELKSFKEQTNFSWNNAIRKITK